MSRYQHVILAIDEGTSGTRAAVISAEGRVDCLTYQPLRVDSPQHGIVEQDANQILSATLAVCLDTISQARQKNLCIVALAISTQRSTAVLWDAKTGKALVPSMVWQDSRYASELEKLGQTWDEKLRATIGRPAGIRSPYLWAVHHIANTPQVASALKQGRLRFGTIDSWLLWHLSTEQPCITTPTNATSANAYCLKEHRYMSEWLEALQFPESLLPELRNDEDHFGQTRQDLLGISVPIMACMGDQFAGALGLGVLHRGQSFCLHGTGSFVDVIAGPQMPELNKQCESTLVMTARRQKNISQFSVETFVPATGSALNWICEQLGWFDSAQHISELAAQANSSGGISFIPALTGLRVPQLQPKVRASLNGISISSTRTEIAHAILEGIAWSVADCLQANTEASGINSHELIVGGGMSNSDTLLQIQADISGIPVLRLGETARASLRGAAFLAGSGGLLWGSLSEACNTLQIAKRFEPAISSDLREARRSGWKDRLHLETETASRNYHVNQELTPL